MVWDLSGKTNSDPSPSLLHLRPHNWHPPTISNHTNEQCHTPSREMKNTGMSVWMWQGRASFFCCFEDCRTGAWRHGRIHPHCQDGLLCADLLPHCFLLVQSGLLGLLPLPVKRYGCYWCESYSLNPLKRRCPFWVYLHNPLCSLPCFEFVSVFQPENCIHVILFAPNSPMVSVIWSIMFAVSQNLQGKVN